MSRAARLRTTAIGSVIALVLTACIGNSNGVTATASFDDVVDLVVNAGVRMNDVQVGRISAIDLTEDNRARVTMVLDSSRPIPADVEAVLARTSVLGERYIDLVPMGDDPACCITDGTVITATSVRADLEELIAAGSDLLVTVSADAVATAIRTGAEAFGGRSELIASFITDVRTLARSFNDNSDDLLALIDALDGVTAAYAANAGTNAATLGDLRVALAALQELDDQLLDTLDDITSMSIEAGTFLADNQDELQNSLRRLRMVLQQVEAADDSVRTLLEIGPRYLNLLRRGGAKVSDGEERDETQVWLDVILCGINDTPGDQSRACDPPNPGQPGEDPGYHPVPEECWDNPTPCTGRED
jgi:phospholipid/cholesterol/gamma-HCH transport system substrate-binding protein